MSNFKILIIMLQTLFTDLLNTNYYGESVVSTENGLKIKIMVPGYGKEDFEIEQEGNLLVVKSKVPEFKTKKYELPHGVKSISATCDKGILEIDLFKSKKEKKSISIN